MNERETSSLLPIPFSEEATLSSFTCRQSLLLSPIATPDYLQILNKVKTHSFQGFGLAMPISRERSWPQRRKNSINAYTLDANNRRKMTLSNCITSHTSSFSVRTASLCLVGSQSALDPGSSPSHAPILPPVPRNVRNATRLLTLCCDLLFPT